MHVSCQEACNVVLLANLPSLGILTAVKELDVVQAMTVFWAHLEIICLFCLFPSTLNGGFQIQYR